MINKIKSKKLEIFFFRNIEFGILGSETDLNNINSKSSQKQTKTQPNTTVIYNLV